MLLAAAAGGLAARPRGGRPRAPELPGGPAPVWRFDPDWDHKDLSEQKKPRPTAGRSRGARRTAFYEVLQAYAALFGPLVQAEFDEEKEVLREQLQSWSSQRLKDEGILLTGLNARPLPSFYGAPRLQLSIDAPRSSPRPPLPFHRFTSGDMVAIAIGDSPILPVSSADGIDALQDMEVGILLERTSSAIQLVVRRWPLSEPTPGSKSGAKGSERARQRFCLTRHVSGVPYERCTNALRAVTDPNQVSISSAVRQLIVWSTSSALTRTSAPSRNTEAGEISVLALSPPEFLAALPNPKSVARQALEALRGSGTTAEAFSNLNPSQENAIRGALRRRLSLIQGPPGTLHMLAQQTSSTGSVQKPNVRRGANGNGRGKERRRQNVAPPASNGASAKSSDRFHTPVLAVAASNVAADEILAGLQAIGVKAIRVGQPATVREALRNCTLEAILERQPAVLKAKEGLKAAQTGRFDTKSGPESRASATGKAFDSMRKVELSVARQLLSNAPVVVTTCVGAGKLAEYFPELSADGRSEGDAVQNVPAVRFRSVLIDEATQATEPSSLIPLCFGCEQVFLVGDPQQLPPTIVSRSAAEGGLSISLFERLEKVGLSPLLLDTQYRSHPALVPFHSTAFYQKRIISAVTAEERPLPTGLRWPAPTCPACFVPVLEGKESLRQGNNSYANVAEVGVVTAVVQAVLRQGDLKPNQIGIITPYNAQAQMIQEALGDIERVLSLRSKEMPDSFIEVSSVDGFQGREKELIIISTVRSNAERRLGFVADARRLNVAITRARRGLIVIGDPVTLGTSAIWSDFITWLRIRNCFVDSVTELLPPK